NDLVMRAFNVTQYELNCFVVLPRIAACDLEWWKTNAIGSCAGHEIRTELLGLVVKPLARTEIQLMFNGISLKHECAFSYSKVGRDLLESAVVRDHSVSLAGELLFHGRIGRTNGRGKRKAGEARLQTLC